MNETHTSWIQRAGQWGLLARAGLLLVLFSAFLLVAIPVAWFTKGSEGIMAAALASAICLVAGWLAMAATTWMAPPNQPAAHVLLGMILRMGLPLALCLIILQNSAWLKDAGFGWYLVATFSLGLAIETMFSVGQLQSDSTYRTPTQPKGSRPNPSRIPPSTGDMGSSTTALPRVASPSRDDSPGTDPTLLRSI